MRKEISNKITNINFILIVFIVLLHSNSIYFVNDSINKYIVVDFLNKFVNSIGHIAVPTLFCLSSYLYFRNFDISKYREKIITRIKSLVIPYFFWSIFFFVYTLAISFAILKLNLQLGMSIADFNFDILKIIKDIVFCTYNGPLWYIKNLFIYIVISPILYYFVKKFKRVNYLFILIIVLINIVRIPYYTGLLYWFPFFYVSTYIAINYKNAIENEKINISKWKWLILLGGGVLILLVTIYEKNERLYYIYRLIAPLIVWIICYKSKNLTKKPINVTRYSFFIYCTHLPTYYSIISLFQNVLLIFFGNNPLFLVFLRFITCFLVIIILILIAKISNKLFPKFTKLILGGRI